MNAENLLQDSLDKYVFVFSDCVPVAGHAASAIYDLTRGQISTFPSAYYPFFALFRTRRVHEILAELSTEEHADFAEFLDFLIAQEYITFVDDTALFPEISKSWDQPSTIHDAIIDVREQHHDYRKIIEGLDLLGCQHLQVRAYTKMFGLADLAQLARSCHGTSIQSLEAVLAHDPARSVDDYVSLATANRIIVGLVIHSADEDRTINVDYGARGSSAKLVAMEIRMTVKPIESHLDCGYITTRQLLSPSTPTFNELLRFNGCLNRKVSIDERGDVRNCPAMNESFGDHQTVSLTDVVAREDFRRAWAARNDEIRVCRDCPYRYACTGCRALLEDPDAADSKPLKCGYDPYTDTWAEWQTRPNARATMQRYRGRLHLPMLPS